MVVVSSDIPQMHSVDQKYSLSALTQRVWVAGGSFLEHKAKFKAREDIWQDLSLQAYGGMTYAGRKEEDEQLHLARDILCKIQTNSFDRTDVDTGQAGIFLHPTLAMVNHSCVPNANVSFLKRKAFLKAEVPIKEGDGDSSPKADGTEDGHGPAG